MKGLLYFTAASLVVCSFDTIILGCYFQLCEDAMFIIRKPENQQGRCVDLENFCGSILTCKESGFDEIEMINSGVGRLYSKSLPSKEDHRRTLKNGTPYILCRNCEELRLTVPGKDIAILVEDKNSTVSIRPEKDIKIVIEADNYSKPGTHKPLRLCGDGIVEGVGILVVVKETVTVTKRSSLGKNQHFVFKAGESIRCNIKVPCSMFSYQKWVVKNEGSNTRAFVENVGGPIFYIPRLPKFLEEPAKTPAEAFVNPNPAVS